MDALEEETIKALYVEDDEGTRVLLEKFLRSKFPALTLQVANNGQEGLDLFRQYQADLIITDISMPVMNGVEMSTAIRKEKPDVVIIAITAYSDVEYLVQAIDLGISHYIMKPVEYKRLQTAVEKSVEYLAVRREASGRERIEEALRVSEAKYHALFNAIPTPLCVTDRQTGTVAEVNRALVVELGYQPEEVLGKAWGALPLWEKGDVHRLPEASPNHAGDVKLSIRKKDGRTATCSIGVRQLTFGKESLLLYLIAPLKSRS